MTAPLTDEQAVALARYCARDGGGAPPDFAARTSDADDAEMLARYVLAVAPVVAAARRVRADIGDSVQPEWSWWVVNNDNEDCLWCICCQGDDRRTRTGDGDEGAIDHKRDCSALALDAALAALDGAE